ncbi:MAG TPA: MlaD family protein [Gemmatimonadaceae bacterium]|nr:MlaD family protein [Gemmatimonadaceae bacterium]HTD60799.1 MlaD family protein [Gemmatimonadaceae bacterium]
MRQRDAVLVGLVTAVAILVLVFGTVYLIRGGLSSGYPLYSRFRWGAGVKQGQPVLLSGVSVGYVDNVELVPDGTVSVRLSIENKYRIPINTVAAIEPNGLFGDMEVALKPARPTTQYIAKNDTIPTAPPAPGISDLIMKMDSIGGQLGDVTKAVQVELVQGGAIGDLRKTLYNANKLVETLSQIATDESKQLSRTMASLNRAVSAVDSSAIDSTVKNIRTSSANLTTLTSNLSNTTSHLDALVAKIDTGGGSAGKLVNDPELYNHVNSLVARLDSLTLELKTHPGKFVPPIHIF